LFWLLISADMEQASGSISGEMVASQDL